MTVRDALGNRLGICGDCGDIALLDGGGCKGGGVTDPYPDDVNEPTTTTPKAPS